VPRSGSVTVRSAQVFGLFYSVSPSSSWTRGPTQPESPDSQCGRGSERRTPRTSTIQTPHSTEIGEGEEKSGTNKSCIPSHRPPSRFAPPKHAEERPLPNTKTIHTPPRQSITRTHLLPPPTLAASVARMYGGSPPSPAPQLGR
jgi:hypothetical protein